MKRKHTLYVSRKLTIWAKITLIGLLFLAALALSSCKTQQPTVIGARNDSAAVHNDHAHGFRLVRDSVFIREKGDTVWLERWHIDYRDSVRTVCDTVYQNREVVRQLPPERYIPPWAWWSLGFSIVVVILVIARIILRIYLRR